MNSRSKASQSSDESQAITIPAKPGLKALSLEDLRGVAQQSLSSPDGSIDDNRQRLTDQRLKERETERQGVEKYYELRDKWSRYIRDYVWAMIAFQFIVTAAVGSGWVDFIDYQILITLVVGQNFGQIIGMGIIVAKFLFSDPKKSH